MAFSLPDSRGSYLNDITMTRSPDLFDIENIRRDVGHNWALKLTNLKKVCNTF